MRRNDPMITKNTTIGEVLNMDRGTAAVFFSFGMGCIGCPPTIGESIEMAAVTHGIDGEKLVDALNEYFAKKAQQ